MKKSLWMGAALCMLLAGCSAGASDPTPDPGSAAQSTAATDSGNGSGDPIVIGWSQRGISGSDWWKTLVDGGQYAADKEGVTIDLLDANGDTVRQNSDVQTLIAKGVDAVIMNPNDPIGVEGSVAALKEAGIPLIVVNSNLNDDLVPDIFCYVAEDQVATGALSGVDSAQKAIEKFGEEGTLKVVAIGGFPGDVISDLRYSGFISGWNSVMADYPGIETVELDMKYGEWKPDKALGPVRDVATGNPDLNVVFNESDVALGGIEQGLKQAGMWDQVLIGSYDGGMNAVKMMVDDPNGPLQNTASNQPWDQGMTAVEMALAAIRGDQDACSDGIYYIETTLVTTANASEYYIEGDTYVRALED